MINKVMLIGRVGQEPAFLETNGYKIANFSLATSESYKTKDGLKQEKTEWHKCVCFGKSAEYIEKHLQKGCLVYVEGSLQTSSFEKGGEKVTLTKVHAKDIRILKWNEESNAKDTEKAKKESTLDDEDIPF